MKYLKLIRIKHWLKNALIFFPLFFNRSIFESNKLLICLMGFFVFSLISSTVYVINDIMDIENDRKHAIKKNRPLAAGIISINEAKGVIAILFILSLIIMTFSYFNIIQSILIYIIPIFYLILNIFYSTILKHYPIIDVVVLSVGFLLRIIYGGVITDIEVSKWLYLMVIFGSLFMGFGKRRNEIIKNDKESRKVLQFYTKEFLDKNMYVCLTLAIVSYTLWCVDDVTITRINNDLLYWTVPVLMVILQLYSLNIEKDSHGDPVEVILSDRKLISLIIIFIVLITFIVYGL